MHDQSPATSTSDTDITLPTGLAELEVTGSDFADPAPGTSTPIPLLARPGDEAEVQIPATASGVRVSAVTSPPPWVPFPTRPKPGVVLVPYRDMDLPFALPGQPPPAGKHWVDVREVSNPFARKGKQKPAVLADLAASLKAEQTTAIQYAVWNLAVVSGTNRVSAALAHGITHLVGEHLPDLTTETACMGHLVRCDVQTCRLTLDTAQYIFAIKSKDGLTDAALCSRHGINAPTFCKYQSILTKLPQPYLVALSDNRLTFSVALAASRIKDAAVRDDLLRQALAGGELMTLAEFNELAKCKLGGNGRPATVTLKGPSGLRVTVGRALQVDQIEALLKAFVEEQRRKEKEKKKLPATAGELATVPDAAGEKAVSQ